MMLAGMLPTGLPLLCTATVTSITPSCVHWDIARKAQCSHRGLQDIHATVPSYSTAYLAVAAQGRLPPQCASSCRPAQHQRSGWPVPAGRQPGKGGLQAPQPLLGRRLLVGQICGGCHLPGPAVARTCACEKGPPLLSQNCAMGHAVHAVRAVLSRCAGGGHCARARAQRTLRCCTAAGSPVR